MSVQPTNPGPLPGGGRPESSRVTGRHPVRERNDEVTAGGIDSEAGDQVAISDAARALQGQPVADLNASELSPERLRQVLSRLVAGHYRGPEVLNVVARRVVDDLRAR